MGVLLGCLLAHALVAQLIPWPWWVPDITLVGLVLAVGRSPGQWLALSGLSGLWTVVWAVRFQGAVFIGYLALGWAVQALTRRWDATEVRVQAAMVAMASLFMTAGALWLDELWSWPLLGLAGAHVVMTCVTLPIARLACGPLSGRRVPVG